jgi:hypothetical protein
MPRTPSRKVLNSPHRPAALMFHFYAWWFYHKDFPV